jgi:hypothetical protein
VYLDIEASSNIQIHIYFVVLQYFYNIIVSILDPTMRLYKRPVKSWVCDLWGPEDDPVKVETCRPDSILF